MFERNKCKVNEPHAKLEHRRFTIMTSTLFYGDFVRKPKEFAE
jgi:hypothetical protein